MKIRELFENTVSVNVYAEINFMFDTSIQDDIEPIKNAIKQIKVSQGKLVIDNFDEESVLITIVELQRTTKNDIIALVKEVSTQLVKLIEPVIQHTAVIMGANNIPTKPLVWDDVQIYLPGPMVLPKLSMLDGCQTVSFANCEYIKGGVLNFLTLKCDNIELDGDGVEFKKWSEIIYDCLENQLDILEGKERLVNAGLKEYAKL